MGLLKQFTTNFSKVMRKHVFLSMLGMAALFLVNGCQKPTMDPPYLTLVGESEFTIDANGGPGSVEYRVTNPVQGASVSLSTDPAEVDWVTGLAAASGAVTFNVEVNTAMEERSAKVILSYPQAAETVEFTIKQAAAGKPVIKLASTTVSVTSAGGPTTVTYDVTNALEGLTLTVANAPEWITDLEVGEEETLIATIMPNDATNKTVTWNVEPAGVITVDNGKITAIASGNAVVIASAGEKRATCNVTVNKKETTTINATYYMITVSPTGWAVDANHAFIFNKDGTGDFDGAGTYTIDNGVITITNNVGQSVCYAKIDGNILWLFASKEDVNDISKSSQALYSLSEITQEDRERIESIFGDGVFNPNIKDLHEVELLITNPNYFREQLFQEEQCQNAYQSEDY